MYMYIVLYTFLYLIYTNSIWKYIDEWWDNGFDLLVQDSCPDKLTPASQISSTAIEGGGSSPATTDTVSSTTTNAKTSTNIKTTTIPSTSTPFTSKFCRQTFILIHILIINKWQTCVAGICRLVN